MMGVVGMNGYVVTSVFTMMHPVCVVIPQYTAGTTPGVVEKDVVVVGVVLHVHIQPQ